MLVQTVSNRANTAGVSPWFLTLASAGLFPASTVQLPLRTKGCGTPFDVAQLVASEFSDRPLALVSKHDPSIETSSFASGQPDLTWWLLRDQGFEAIAQDQMAWMVLVTILSILLVFAAIMVAAMAMRMVARLCLQRIAKNLQPLTKRHSMVHVGWRWSLRAQICAQFRNDWTEQEGNIKQEGKIAASVLSRRVSALSYCLEQWKPVQLQRCNSLAKTFSATPERSRDSRHDNQNSAFGTLTEKVEKMCNKLPLAVISTTIPCINAEVTCKLEDFVKYVHGETVSDQAELSIVQAIAQALDDEDHDVQEKAAEVLGRFLAKKLKSLVALHDPNSEVKQNAAARLRELLASNRSLVCVLVAHVTESGSRSVRSAAVGSLGKLLDSFAEAEESGVLYSLEGNGTLDQAELSIVQAITQALDDSNSYVRWKAAEVLGRFLAKKLKSLVALHDPNSEVKQNAAARLRELLASDRSLFCVLVACVTESGSWRVRSAAVGSLGELLDSFAETEESRVLNSLEGNGTLDQAELSIVQAITQALDDNDSYVREEAAEVLGRFLAKKLKSLVALHDPNSEVKQNAAARLRELLASDRSLVCVLVAHVTENGSRSVRDAAVGLLGKLLDSFAEAEESGVLYSLEGNGTLDQAELSIVQAIAQALDDSDSYVRWKAAEVLCRFLAKKLKSLVALHDPNSEVKQNAAARLRELLASDRSLVCVLVAHVTESGSGSVRNAAVCLLGFLLDSFAVLYSLEGDGTLDQAELSIVQAITQALDDEDHDVQEKAAEVLGRFLAKKLKSLVALHDPNSEVKQNAAARLRELLASNRSLVCVLVAHVTESGSWSVRRDTVGSLGEILDSFAEAEESRVLNSSEGDGTLDQAELSIVQAIAQALDDSNSYVRWKAAEVLGRFLAKKLKSLVALHDPNSEVKQNAAARLRELLASDRSLVCVLVARVTENGSRSVRDAAVGLLGKLLDSFAEAEESRVLNSLEGNGTLDQAELSIVQAIAQALDDSDSYVRWEAEEVLGRFLAKKLKSLVALHDPNSEVKQNAAARLRELLASDRSLFCVLVEHVTESGSRRVRSAAVGSLGKLLDSFAETEESRVLNSLEGNGTLDQAELSIVQAITQALDDNDSYVRWIAAKVLGRFLAKKLKSLQVALHDPNSEVKQNAAARLRELLASDRSLVCVLVARVTENGSRSVRNAAVGLLGFLLDSFAVLYSLEGDGTLDQAELSIVQAITQALDDEDHDVQEKAAEVLGRFLAKKIKSLVALHDPNSKVKQNAAARLRELLASDRSLFCVLVVHVTESGSRRVRNAAVGSLGELLDFLAEAEESGVLYSLEGDGTLDQAELSIAQAITQALDDEDHNVQEKAAEVLCRFLAEKLKSLVALHDPNSEVKQHAAAQLRELFASDRSLVAALSDQAAQNSIGKLLAGADRNAFSAADFGSAVEELVECVVDKLCDCSLQHAPTAKLAMIDILSSRITLTRTGDARKQLAASKLTMMLKNIDPDVKRKCAVALCKQGMPWATPAISVLLRLLPQAVDDEVLRRLETGAAVNAVLEAVSQEEIEALAHVTSWAQTKDQLRIVTLFLDFVAHQHSKRVHEASKSAIPILQRVHDLGLEGVKQAGKSAIPILLTFLEVGSREQQLAATEGLQIIAQDLKPDSAVALIEDILLGPQSSLCPPIDRKVEPFPVKNWILSAVKSAQCLIADLPSPWTLVAGAAAFILFSSQDPLAELLNHPHVIVRSHNHIQWGFSCCVPHIYWLQRQISLRYSWQAYREWFRKPWVDKFRSLTRGQKSFEQVLSLDEEQRLCDALQAFQLVTRFEVVPKTDLSGPALASVFARFGLKVFRNVRKDGVALLAFASNGSRPTLINVEAIERVVQRGFFPEQFHLLSPVVPVLRPSWLLVDFAVVIIQVACCISCIATPLAFFTFYELARVPFYPKSPVDSLTEFHFGQRFPQLSERLLLASPVLTCTLAAYAAAVFASLIFAYCTEILPLAPLPILQALLPKNAADPVLHQSATSNRINPTLSGVGHGIFATTMKSIAWFAFFLSFAQITGALALLAFWLGFGVVVEPERFIPVVSALLSFMFAVAGRLRSLMNWRRSLAEGIQEILQSCAAVLWVSLMERMNISVSAQSASYQRLVQGIASDMDLFDLLLDGQETQLLTSSRLCCFLAPIIDQVTFKMLLNNVQNRQERDCV